MAKFWFIALFHLFYIKYAIHVHSGRKIWRA